MTKMISRLILFCLVSIMASTAMSQTILYLRNTNSKLGTVAFSAPAAGCANGINNWTYRLASTTPGSSTTTANFQPASGAPPCLFQTSNSGQFLIFASPPLSAAVTISGGVDSQLGCYESTRNLNSAVGYLIYRWTQVAGRTSLVLTGPNSSECSTGGSFRTIPTSTPTSTAFKKGDRILIHIQVRNQGGAWGGDSNRNLSFYYDDSTSNNFYSYVQFSENISFQADVPQSVGQIK
jgi:hypothetical protein